MERTTYKGREVKGGEGKGRVSPVITVSPWI